MRRVIISVLTICSVLAAAPDGVTASSPQRDRGSTLINAYQRQLLGTSEADPWLFDDGCIGGTSHRDPAFMLVPFTETPVTESACTIDRHATLVIVPDGFTCFGDAAAGATAADVRDECETAWADPAQALVTHQVVVDGRTRRTKQYRTSGEFTFPTGALLDTPGKHGPYYAITDAVILHDLEPGTHTIFVSYRYADGLNGATMFTLTVTK